MKIIGILTKLVNIENKMENNLFKGLMLLISYHRKRLTEPDCNKYHYIIKRGNNHIDYVIQMKK